MSANTNPILQNLLSEYFRSARFENIGATPDKTYKLDSLEKAIRIESGLPCPKKDVRLFGICGKMKHGKDTFYSFITNCDPSVIRVAFADALKKEVAAACGVTVDFINSNKDIFRPMLQWWGTEFRRGLCGDDYWLRCLEDTINGLPDGSTVFVTDVRFLNEANFIHTLGGHVVKVTRIGAPAPAGSTSGHASEVELEQIQPDSHIAAECLIELNTLSRQWWAKQNEK